MAIWSFVAQFLLLTLVGFAAGYEQADTLIGKDVVIDSVGSDIQHSVDIDMKSDFDWLTYERLNQEYGSELKHASECGGYIEGLAGVISYKFGEIVANNEACVWTILAPQKETIQVQLLADGFYSNLQTVSVYNTSQTTRYQMKYAFAIERNDRRVHNATGGSLIQIAFGSHPFLNYNGTGFVLTFEGVGPDTNGSDWRVPIFKVYEQGGIDTGVVNYVENSSSSPAEGEFVILTIHPAAGKEVALTVESFRGPSRSSSCAWNEDYWYDTLRVTELSWSGGLANLFQECRWTTYNTTIYSPYPLVISLYSFTSYSRAFDLSWAMVDVS